MMKHESLRVYVAGSSNERRERAIPMIAALRALGVIITFDWTEAMERIVGTAPPNSDNLVDDETRLRCSELDMNGVRKADFVLLMAPKERGSSGAWVELGLAIAFRVPVIVTGEACRRTIFTSLAHRCFTSDAEGFEYLKSIQDERCPSQERGPGMLGL